MHDVTDSSNQRAKAKCVGRTRAHAPVFSREPALRSRAPPSLDPTPPSAVAAGPSTTTTMGQSSSNTGHSGESLEFYAPATRYRSRAALLAAGTTAFFVCARARVRAPTHARTYARTHACLTCVNRGAVEAAIDRR